MKRRATLRLAGLGTVTAIAGCVATAPRALSNNAYHTPPNDAIRSNEDHITVEALNFEVARINSFLTAISADLDEPYHTRVTDATFTNEETAINLTFKTPDSHSPQSIEVLRISNSIGHSVRNEQALAGTDIERFNVTLSNELTGQKVLSFTIEAAWMYKRLYEESITHDEYMSKIMETTK